MQQGFYLRCCYFQIDEPILKPKELLQGRVIKLAISHGALQRKPFCLLFKVAGVMQCK